MKKTISPLFGLLALPITLTIIGCTTTPETPHAPRDPRAARADADYDTTLAQLFGTKTGCLIIRDAKSGTLVHEFNAPLCKRRFYPASSFKVALAVMGFDSGILADENSSFKWDGTPQPVKQWEADHTARTWLRDSVGWYSQRLTPQLGLERIRRYLQAFNYGNQDFTGGITTAWNSSTLKISAEEQVDFLLRLQSKQLDVSGRAVDITLALLPVAVEEMDLRISGKTGTNFSWSDPAMDSLDPYMIGWYIGYMSHGPNTYAFAVMFTDKSEKGRFFWAGGEARKIAVAALRRASVAGLRRQTDRSSGRDGDG